MTMGSDDLRERGGLDHPWFGDADGHNCIVCDVREDALHLCWKERHAPMSHRWEGFLLRACDALDGYEPQGDRTEHLIQVSRMAAHLWAADPFDLDEQAAVMVAALCHAAAPSGPQEGRDEPAIAPSPWGQGSSSRPGSVTVSGPQEGP